MMNLNLLPEIINDDRPSISLLKLGGVIAATFFLTQFAIFVLLHFLHISPQDFSKILNDGDCFLEYKIEILSFQAIFHLGIYTFSSVGYLFFLEKKRLTSLNVPGTIKILPILLSLIIPILLTPANSWVIHWNQEIHLARVLGSTEEWMRTVENGRKQLTSALTKFSSFKDFIFTFIVVAVFGAIGEELIFRGLIQSKLTALIKNQHFAIWIAAILFSAVHFQFFGFFPRLLLGALFGYMYCWSKNILYPILAHFTNNGLTVLLIYLYDIQLITFNIEEATLPSLSYILISIGGSSILVFIFWRLFYFNSQGK
jgi:uncharacterized protein